MKDLLERLFELNTLSDLEHWVNAVLQNDEASSDQELIDYFIRNGLDVEAAKKAVSQRSKCLRDPYYKVEL